MSAAEAAGVSERTAAKWLARWRAEGDAGLLDRSSAPKIRPTQLPPERVETSKALRRLRMTAAEIAECLRMALSTVSRWLKRIGLGKLSRLAPPEPPNRYERKRAGELVHVDVKKLGRIRVPGHRMTGNRRTQRKVMRAGLRVGASGWEFVHACVDDATRLAYAEVLGDERATTAVGFLRRAVRWFASMGITIERVMSDNGACYRSRLHAAACRELGLRHSTLSQPHRRVNANSARGRCRPDQRGTCDLAWDSRGGPCVPHPHPRSS
jgi:leucine-zipper of insertion element IS481/Integrase core domain